MWWGPSSEDEMKKTIAGSAVALTWCVAAPFAQQAPSTNAPAHNVYVATGCLDMSADATPKFKLTDASSTGRAAPAPASEAGAVGTSGLKASYELQPVSGLNAQGMDADTKEAKTLFSFYQHLIEFRKKRTAMQGRTRDTLDILSSNDRVVCFERKFRDDHILVILNFNKVTFSFTLPSGLRLNKIFDSASSQWDGPDKTNLHTSEAGKKIDLMPESVVILEIK